ncbi:hypothetical protein F1880_010119 [Penicillium rolfsii]|nr:hypothetical protein F1880_010119 [Penicillium rolfsii]
MSYENHPGSFPVSHETGSSHAEHEPPSPGVIQTKPIRLALACNQCRKRKVRCDAQYPSCRNCIVRGDVCETSDPRKPGNFPAVRRRAASTRYFPSKTRGGEVEKTHTPQVQSSLTAVPPAVVAGAVSSINSVLNPTGPSPDNLVNHTPASARRSSKSSAVPVPPSVSPATSSWRTTQSERLGEDHFSWQSRAYQDCAEAQGQDVVQEHDPVEQNSAVTPNEEAAGTDDSTNNRSKHLGASSVQCLFNFVDLHLARYGFSHATPLFKHCMLHSEEFPMPLIPKLPILPDRQDLSTHIDSFFSRIWTIYPVIDRTAFEADLETVIGLQTAGANAWQEKVTLSHVPGIVSVYAVISLGMNEISGKSDSSFDYLTASHSLHGHLTAIPYMPSVQALSLLALALRAIAKDGQAWHIIGHAIRMAQSIGLHKSATKHPSEDGFTLGFQPETLRERLWWSLFGLEKLMQLECGRPSIIDRSYDSLTVTYPASTSAEHTGPYFRAWIALSSIMGKISNRLYSHKFMGGSAELLGEVAKLDRELLEWENSLPDTLKPQRALTDHYGHGHQVLAAYLSQQYYYAQLSVLRVAVIYSSSSIKAEVTKNITSLPHHARLLDGALICANAARTIVTQSLQLEDSGLNSALLSVSPTYLAAVVLALGVLRQPTSRLVRSDIELLASGTEYVENWFLQRGVGKAFTQTCTHLRERIMSVFQRGVGRDGHKGVGTAHVAGSVEPGYEMVDGQQLGGSGEQVLHSVDGGNKSSLQGMVTSNMGEQGTSFFGGFDLEDFWNMDFMVYDEENPLFVQ